MRVGRRRRRRVALEVDVDGVAVIDAAAFDRLEPRRAIAQPLQRLIDRLVVDGARRRGVSAIVA